MPFNLDLDSTEFTEADKEPGLYTMRFNAMILQEDERSLRDAATFGDMDELRRICSKDGVRADSTDENGIQAIHKAAEQGHLEVVKFLVDEQGCDPQATTPDGRTTLHWACSRAQNLALLKYLVAEKGLAVDAPDENGWQPLHVAAHGHCHKAIMYFIGECQVNIQVQTGAGELPIDLARSVSTTTPSHDLVDWLSEHSPRKPQYSRSPGRPGKSGKV